MKVEGEIIRVQEMWEEKIRDRYEILYTHTKLPRNKQKVL